MSGKKVRDFVEYPNNLNMESVLERDDNVDDQGTKYELMALTEHVGRSGSSGHYIAYAKRDGRWFCFDDEYFK